MRFPTITFAGALIAISLFVSGAAAQDPLQYVKEGDAAYLAKDYARAAQSYIQAIKLDPESPELYERLGHVYQEQHNQRFTLAFKKADELRAKRGSASQPAAPADLTAAKAAYAAKDYVTAMKGFRNAADQGSPNAQFDLGLMYEEGQGVPVDLQQARAWYEKAASQHYSSAIANLAYLYSEGAGVPVNLELARKLYLDAASLGVASSMYSLGSMYYAGEGGPKDLMSAYVWWKIAAGKQNAKAAANAALFEKQMTAEEFRQAQERVREMTAKLPADQPAGK